MGDPRRPAVPIECVMSVVIGISGKIAAGKTTWSNKLAERLGLKRASFGDYLRKRLNSSDRETLIEAGAELVRLDATAFARSVLDDAGWRPGESIVVEGIRHVVILEALREVVHPEKVVLLFVEADAAERAVRLGDRGDVSELADLDAGRTEQDVPKLRELADVILDTHTDLEGALSRILSLTSGSDL